MIIDEIVVGLGIALGKKVIDRVWSDATVPPQRGGHGTETPQTQLLAHTMERRPAIPTRLVEFAILFANEVTPSIRRGGIGLLLAVEERSRGAMLLEVDLDDFELELSRRARTRSFSSWSKGHRT